MTAVLRDVREAADRAAGAVLRLGWSKLSALVAGRVAQFDCNFETDGKLREVIRRPDGAPYHRESIARVRRNLRDAGIISSERVFIGAQMPRAKFRSAHGTTLKAFNWPAVAEKNPLNRRQRRLARQRQNADARAAGAIVSPSELCVRPAATAGRARYSVPPTPAAAPAPPLDPETAALIGKARALSERWNERAAGERTGPVPVRSSASERPPPD